MQVMRDEHEAYGLVRTHLGRTIPDAVVTVLNRDISDNHIAAVTPLADDDDLVDRLRDATPDSRLAIRLAHNGGGASPPLLSCALCAGRRGQLRAIARQWRGDRFGPRPT